MCLDDKNQKQTEFKNLEILGRDVFLTI